MKIQGLRHSSEMVGGIVFFGRMLDKVRVHARGKLPPEYNRGIGFDGRVCRFLGVTYTAVIERVLAGFSDEEILAWCYRNGRHPTDEEIFIFNAFMAKRGWNDDSTAELERMKRDFGYANRKDIQTFFDLHKADET